MELTQEEKRKFVRDVFAEATKVRASGRRINPAVAAAQAILETGYGNSLLCRKAKNLFGTKAGPLWQGEKDLLPTKEWSKEEGWISTKAYFRVYPSFADAFSDYADIIEKRAWYKDSAAFPDDWRKYLRGLLPNPARKEPGWATDPRYEQKIVAVILTFNLDK